MEREVIPGDKISRENSLEDEEERVALVTGTARERLIELYWSIAKVDSLVVPVGTVTGPGNAVLKANPTITETSAKLQTGLVGGIECMIVHTV